MFTLIRRFGEWCKAIWWWANWTPTYYDRVEEEKPFLDTDGWINVSGYLVRDMLNITQCTVCVRGEPPMVLKKVKGYE